MVNVELLRKVTNEINDGVFKWNQSDWIDSGYVPSGLSPDAFANECGTSYCFAGRVATLEREQLYVYDEMSQSFTAGTHVVALDSGESGFSSSNMYIPYYRAVKRDGKIEFVEYRGSIIHAQNAAINDLEINNDAADALFSGSNSLSDINDIVDRIVEQGDNFNHYNDDEVDDDEPCDCEFCVDDEEE